MTVFSEHVRAVGFSITSIALALSLAGLPQPSGAQTATVPRPATGGAATGTTQNPSQASSTTGDRPKVHLVTTGGTIANRAGGRLNAQELLSSVPQIADYAQVDTEEFSNLASG